MQPSFHVPSSLTNIDDRETLLWQNPPCNMGKTKINLTFFVARTGRNQSTSDYIQRKFLYLLYHEEMKGPVWYRANQHKLQVVWVYPIAVPTEWLALLLAGVRHLILSIPETLQCKDGAALLSSEMSRSLIRIFHKKVQNIHMLTVRGNPLSPCLRRLENNYLRSVVPIQ